MGFPQTSSATTLLGSASPTEPYIDEANRSVAAALSN